MLQVLMCHPDTPCPAIERVEAELGPEEPGTLRLSYRIIGDADRVVATRLARGQSPRRRDGLWRHTCCELFVRDTEGRGYREYDFAPSGDWAAYRFSDYRAGSVPLEAAAPRIVLERSPAALALTVTLDGEPLDAFRNRRVGIACIVETRTEVSYWALAHPTGRPDFHEPRSFALTLALEPAADTHG